MRTSKQEWLRPEFTYGNTISFACDRYNFFAKRFQETTEQEMHELRIFRGHIDQFLLSFVLFDRVQKPHLYMGIVPLFPCLCNLLRCCHRHMRFGVELRPVGIYRAYAGLFQHPSPAIRHYLYERSNHHLEGHRNPLAAYLFYFHLL